MSDTRRRLLRFFEHHNPEKIGDVDQILTKYQGREAELFAALAKKYGPEPTGPASPAASPPSSPGRTQSSAPGGADYRARLTRFFEHHNASKVAEVDAVLTKYQGREAELFAALVKKYGPEPDAVSTAAHTGGDRERLTRFFEHHNPEKIGDVDQILTKYQGRETELFAALVKKYGPEPEGGSASTHDVRNEGSDKRDDAGEAKTEDTPQRLGLSDEGRRADATEESDKSGVGRSHLLLGKKGEELRSAIAAMVSEGQLSPDELLRAIPDRRALMLTLQQRFGDYENRLRRIYVRFEPNRLGNEKRSLKDNRGREEELIMDLLRSYGGEQEPRHDAPTDLVRLTSRVKKDNIEEESSFTDEDEEEQATQAPESMFTAVAEARNLLADAERVAAGECSGDDEHTYPKDEESWVRLRFELSDADDRNISRDRLREDEDGTARPGGDNTTVCVGHVLNSYGEEKGSLCFGCSERVSKAFDCLWTPVGPQHRQAVLSSFVKEGYLDKLDRGGKWGRRFFKVKDNGLHYFESDKETDKPKPKGIKFFTNASTVIESVTAEEHRKKGFEPGKFFYFGVTVNPSNEPYFLRTTSEAEKLAWLTFIKEALSRLANSSSCRDPNPGRWRARLEGFKKASDDMAAEASDTASHLFALRKRVEEERALLSKEEEEVSLARTQANEMSEQELALQRVVETAYARLEVQRAASARRVAAAEAKCAEIANQRTKLQKDLLSAQQEVDTLKSAITELHKRIIELEAAEELEESKCRKVEALYRKCEERAKGSRLPSQVFACTQR